jgi:integrase
MGRKRASDEGTIFEYPVDSGIWWAQLPPDEYGKRPKRKARSQKEALALLRAMQKERERGGDPGAQYPLLEEFLHHWLEHTKRPEISEKTYQSYEQTIRLYMLPHLPKKLRVNQLRSNHFELMRNAVLTMTRKRRVNGKLVEVPLAPRTAQLALTVCVMAFEIAAQRYHLPRNEARLVKTLKPTKPKIAPFDEDQIATLLDAIEGHRLQLLYHLALTYGFRKGELLGLRWCDIDITQKTITISGSLQEHKKGRGLIRTEPKTESSERTLPLTDDLLEMIPRHREAIALEYEARKQSLPVNGPVFPSEAGSWIWPRNFTTHYKAVLRRAGLPLETRVHDLRHTMVTTALNNGQPLTVVSKYVGHSSVAITADFYGPRDDSAERKLAESMGAILKKRRNH